MILGLSLGIDQAEQQLSPDLSFVIQTYGPNFRPAVNILLIDFGEGVLLLLVTGVKQSQLLDLSLGLGLEFDKKWLR